MALLQVFDPAMCCSTGVCGPTVDPRLPQFAADLQWLEAGGCTVERYNLAQQPDAFAANSAVKEALGTSGNDCLPLILVDGKIRSRGRYLNREQLAEMAGLPGGSVNVDNSTPAQDIQTPADEAGCCPGLVNLGDSKPRCC